MIISGKSLQNGRREFSSSLTLADVLCSSSWILSIWRTGTGLFTGWQRVSQLSKYSPNVADLVLGQMTGKSELVQGSSSLPRRRVAQEKAPAQGILSSMLCVWWWWGFMDKYDSEVPVPVGNSQGSKKYSSCIDKGSQASTYITGGGYWYKTLSCLLARNPKPSRTSHSLIA